MFQNVEIALGDLPDMEDLEWQQLHPRYVRRMQVERILIVLAALAASALPYLFLEGMFNPGIPLWALVIVFSIPFLGWPLISVPRLGYVVRDKDIIFKSGVVWRSVTAIPYNRVQHVETSSTPFDRKFGIANLKIFTAGGSGGDLQISGLGLDTAEQLRVYILDKVGASIENH
jgi:hypothetical protein